MIKRPGNEFTIVDQSGQYLTTETPEMAPLLLTASSFDKGPENLLEVSGDDFFRLFGENISFEKHGQPAIQAANVIRNGGRLLIKRIVADDATVANAVITATVSKVQVPKVDPTTGQNIYIDRDTGVETTEATSSTGQNNERAIINTANIKYNVVSVEGAKTMKELQLACAGLLVEKDPIVGSDTETGTDTGSGDTTTAEETAKALEEAASNAEVMVHAITGIAEASSDQAQAITQVTQGLDQVSSVVQTNSATAEESAAASQELSDQASVLKGLIAKFKMQ